MYRLILAAWLLPSLAFGQARLPPNATINSATPLGLPAPQGFVVVGTRSGMPTFAQNGQGLNQQSLSRFPMRFPAGASEIRLCYYGGTRNNGVTPASTWAMSGITGSGGTGYAVGDTITMAATGANRAAILRVTQVSAGAFVKGVLDDPGWYYTQLPDATAQASTSGAGSGATFTYNWTGYALGVTASVEPVWGTQIGTGANAIVPATLDLGRASGGQANNYDIMVPPGRIVCSDPITVSVPVGAQAGIRTFAQGVSMGMGGAAATALEGWQIGTSNAYSPSAPLTATMTSLNYNAGFVNSAFVQPLMVLGRPKVYKPTLCFVGDSIAVGTNGGVPATNGVNTDVGDADGNRGWMARGTNSAYPYTNLASGGDAFTTTFATPAQFQAELAMISMSGCSAVVMELSINDFGGNSKTAAQVLAYEQQFVAAVRAIPTVKQIIGSTTVPYTFGCSSVSAGTGCAGNRSTICTNLEARNADLRNGLQANGTYSGGASSNYAPLYDLVIDFGTTIETTTSSCLWQASALGDGLHPSTAGHIAMAAVANAIYARLQ